MERNITITLEKEKEWYSSGNNQLKEIALQAFSKDELLPSFKDITTFKKACEALNLHYEVTSIIIKDIAMVSKASAAMSKLNIIRKALNLDQDLHLTKNPEYKYFYYPDNPFITEDSTYYKDELNSGKIEIIGRIKSEEKEYIVLGGDTYGAKFSGLGHFYPGGSVGYADTSIGLLGCVTKEIAEHFGKYFGMLITEAKYGDLVDFEIIENKYQ